LILTKLTDSSGCTKGGTQWGPGITNTATGTGNGLCSDGVIHAYRNASLALFMNPIHANFHEPRAWECEGAVVVDDGTKVGVKRLTCLREVEVPTVQWETRVIFGILVAKAVYKDPSWNKWADRWISGEDRSRESAGAAAAAAAARAAAWAKAARAAAWAAAWAKAARAAAWAAAAAARAAAARAAAARAAESAWAAKAWTERAAEAAAAAWAAAAAAARAAEAGAESAWVEAEVEAAEEAARAASHTGHSIDLTAIAEEAMRLQIA
jgi:hypothetical protein